MKWNIDKLIRDGPWDGQKSSDAMMIFQTRPAHQVINTLILMENTAAEQIKRNLIIAAMEIYVIEVWLVLIVAAAKIMIMLNVDTNHVLIMKMQSKMIEVTSNKK